MKNTSKVLGFAAIIAVIVLNALLITGCPGEDKDSYPSPYIITKSGATFTLTKGDKTATGVTTLSDVIDGIRSDAQGKNCAIQFGDKTTVLDIGSGRVELDNDSYGTWGAIKLTGKITSKISATGYGTISIGNLVSVTSSADIENTDTMNYSSAVYNSGILNITGGTIKSDPKAYAIYNREIGKVTIDYSKTTIVGNIFGM